MSNRQPSTSSHIFLESAEQLAARLEQEPSEEAQALAREARELAAHFAAWPTERPTEAVRATVVKQLFDLNRRAMDYLSS